MALVKYGAGIVQISGSIAGDTHFRNRYGNCIRPRTKPVNPNTWGQNKIRGVLSYLTERWKETLSAATRANWGTYAAAIAMKNRLGETIYLTGFNHYIRSNSNRHYNAQGVVDTAPVELSLPDKDPTVSIDCDSSPQVITVTFDLNMDWVSETGAYMHLRQGMPQNGTRTFFAGPYRHVGVILGSGTPWSTPVPFTPVIQMGLGQKQWCAFRISRADGRLTEIMTAFATVHSQLIGEVPNLIGQTVEVATAVLTAPEVQLILGTVTEANDPNVPIGLIISTDPVAHTYLSAGDAVNVVVSLGPAA